MENNRPMFRQYICSLCDTTSETASQFVYHARTWHTLNGYCLDCEKKIRYDMGTHLLDKHIARNPYVCPYCFNEFLKANKYWTHIQNFHTGAYFCKLCEFYHTSIMEVKHHVHYHHTKKVMCVDCGMIFTDPMEYYIHRQEVHQRRAVYTARRKEKVTFWTGEEKKAFLKV